jgi:hypothetical protein
MNILSVFRKRLLILAAALLPLAAQATAYDTVVVTGGFGAITDSQGNIVTSSVPT